MSEAQPWQPAPSPITVPLPDTISQGSTKWTEITLRAPTLNEAMKATATPGASQADVTRKMISYVSGLPEDVVGELPMWFVTKIDQYFDSFNAGPPLFPTATV